MRRNQYDPEFSESTELGIKTFLFDRRVQLNAAYFINDYAGIQEESTQIDNETKTVASFWSIVAESEYEGFDRTINIKINILMSLNTVSYTHLTLPTKRIV